ncbi:MAG: PilN domain-containing protein [Rhodocyclaceae bacterium]|nr:PilN domain-containing protein [Rhodocyclaceae bacterium]MCA3059203.1 PilN domain-containing protein [Rhodocyclaceae bacterium]MCA3083717.1 PilN domain-containing protein [Rhodocyclaceae bacterium]
MSAVIPSSAETSRPANAALRIVVPRGVVNFWRWWSTELRGVFRPWLDKYWVDRADTVDIQLTADTETTQPTTPLPPRIAGRDVRILVDVAHVLRKSVAYPAVVEENLGAVIENDLDRQTPFTADQIFLAHRIERRYEAADGVAKIDVELMIVLRRVVAPLLERVRAAGGAVYSVVIPGTTDGVPVELLSVSERRSRRLSRLQKVNLLLLAALVLLILAAMMVPTLQRYATVQALTPMVEKARSEAEATRKIETEFQRLLQEYQFATTRKHQAFAAIDIIEELTRLSPDTTWLQSLEMKSPPGGNKANRSVREVQLIGEAAAASKMIELLEQSPLLQNTTQRAQTTRGSQPNTERFQIATELKPRQLPELIDLIAIPPVPVVPTLPKASLPENAAPPATGKTAPTTTGSVQTQPSASTLPAAVAGPGKTTRAEKPSNPVTSNFSKPPVAAPAVLAIKAAP